MGPPTEVITFRTVWVVKALQEGNYNVSVLASSDDNRVDPQRSSVHDSREVQIVKAAPKIGEPVISPVYSLSDFDHQNIHTYPEQDIDVRVNVTCNISIENVTLHYSTDNGGVWNQIKMSNESANDFVGKIPGQSEGELILFYIQAFSSAGKSSRTREFICVVSDLQLLELRTRIIIATTATIFSVGCIAIFALRRRRVTEIL